MPPPHLYAIPADRPFLDMLARGLIALSAGNPLALSEMTVLLPTRRAARSLREAFLRLTAEGGDPGAPLLLPQLRPIGDLDEDETGIGRDANGTDASLAVPPALPDLRRRLLLTQLVLKWSAGTGETPLLPGQAAALAGALARLLDTAVTEGASFDTLAALVPDDLAEHWQVVLKFLDILPGAWPAILAEEGAIDAAERRNRLLRRQAALWRRTPPRAPVIAAGLLGGIPALSDLLSAIAWLDQGTVILPGLDRTCTADEWQLIADEPAHPQYLAALLLRDLGLTPQDVGDWPAVDTEVRASGRGRRLRLVTEALRPAQTTDAWRDLPSEPPTALEGLARYDCASPQEEAATIALLL